MKITEQITQNAHWLLRIAIVSVFLFHGLLKFANLEGFAEMLPISYTEVVLVALAKTGGALLIMLGGFGDSRLADLTTRIGALLNIPVMIGPSPSCTGASGTSCPLRPTRWAASSFRSCSR